MCFRRDDDGAGLAHPGNGVPFHELLRPLRLRPPIGRRVGERAMVRVASNIENDAATRHGAFRFFGFRHVDKAHVDARVTQQLGRARK